MSELKVFKEADWVEPDRRFIFWSGGKDSTAALHLALRAWGIRTPVVFIDTGITLPETLEYIREIGTLMGFEPTILKPDMDFWKYVREVAGFPIIKARWCLRLLKMDPVRKFLKQHPGWKVQVLGIRRKESKERNKHPFYVKKFSRRTKLPFTYNLYPILDWTEQQVDDYLRGVQIPVNPAHEIYGTTGCYWCPFIRSSKHYMALKRRHPDLFQKIVEAENIRKPSTAWPEKSIIPIAEQQILETNQK